MVLDLDEKKYSGQNGDDEGEHSESSTTSRGKTITRLNFLKIGIVSSFGVLIWRLGSLQLDRPPEVREAAARVITREITVKAPRGLIYDRNNKLLVENKPVYSVSITRDLMPNPADPKLRGNRKAQQEAAQKRQLIYDSLARFLGMPYSIVIVPEQVDSRPERNEILNTLEQKTQISARDIEKRIKDARAAGYAQQLLKLKEGIPVTDFDEYVQLRQLYGVYFFSRGEQIVFESEFRTYDFEPITVWSNLSREEANILDEKRMDLPGVGIATAYQRQYIDPTPSKDPTLYSHILGYLGAFRDNDELNKANLEAAKDFVNPDNPDDPNNRRRTYTIDDRIGRAGIEFRLEPYLRGTKGGKLVEVDNTGNIVGDVTNSERKPVPGDNVYLTLDTNLQVVLTKALTDEMNRIRREKRGAKNLTAAGVVMNCKTGEVLALVSLPSFDNNLFRGIGLTSKEDSDLEALLTAPSEVSPLLNRSISGLYPPGSTFKMIPALAALTEGKVRNGTAFNCAQYIYVPTSEDPANPNFRRKFKCWGRHGIQDVLGSIKNSCDVFYYNVGQEYEVSRLTGQPVGYFESPTTTQPFFPFNGVGIDKMNKYMELFQIGKRTGIELPGESAGFLPTKANYPILFPGGNWSVGDSLVTAIGQGNLLMTPLQLCSTTVALANSGKVLQPRIIKKVVDLNGNVKIPDEPVVKTEIQEKDIPRRHFQTIQLGMFQVTQAGGTAQSTMAGKMGRLEVAGKTGTAEYGDSIGKDAEDNLLFATYAWFTCYAPYRNPEIAVSILIATGDNVTEGATYAVPPAKTVLEAYFPNVTAPPTTPTVQPRP